MNSTTNQFTPIWQAAIRKYEEVTHKKLEDLDLKDFDSVSSLERTISQKNEQFAEFREKRSTLFKVMRNALIPVQVLAKLGAGDASAAFPPSSLVFGAVNYLIGAAKNVSDNYDSIRDLMVSLQELTTRLKVYNREMISNELQMKLVDVLTALLEIFALARKAIKHGRMYAFGRSVVLTCHPDVKKAVEKLNTITKSEDLLVGAETHTEVTRQGRTLDGMVTVVSKTHAEISESRTEHRQMHNELVTILKETQSTSYETSNHRDMIKKILRPSVFPQDTYKRLIKEKVPGTGEWIFAERVFTAWRTNKTFPVLFIQGIPGAGKSFLSANMVSYFLEQYPYGAQDSARVSIAYFFFKDNNPETRSIHQALRDVAFQVYLNDAVYAKHVDTMCQSFDDIKTIESAWQKLFLEFFIDNEDSDSSAFIILDGLDEGYKTERETFLPLLQEMKHRGGEASRLQLALVGRPHLSDDIADALENDSVPTISIDGSKNSGDITNYIQSSIRRSRTLKKVSKELQIVITKTLTERANGLFLWVDLMIRELNHKNRESTIREALEKAPKGLDDMIRHVLERISESLSLEDAQDLNDLLAWVTCAKKPLTLGHLDVILSLRSPTADGLLNLESMLRKNYASFFVLAREDGLSTIDLLNLNQNASADEQDSSSDDDDPGFRDVETLFDSNPLTTEVNFCHASIGDFFRDRRQGKVRSAHGHLVGVAIDDANFQTMKTVILVCVDSRMREKALQQNFLTGYAAPFWWLHMRDTDILKTKDQDKMTVGPYLIKFCREPSVIEIWAWHRGYDFWFNDYTTIFRKWLDDEVLLNSLSSEDQERVKSTAQHPASTFVALAKLNAMKWLQDKWWKPEVCAWSTFGYRQSIAGSKLRTAEEGFESAHDIEESAEWAGYEKTALWHRRLAIALRQNSFLDEAQKHFEAALDLDPTMWRVRGGLARVASCREDYQNAIDLAANEIEVIEANPAQEPESRDIELAATLELKAECYNLLDDTENAFLSYRQASEANPFKYTAIAACVDFLDENDRYHELITLFREVCDKSGQSPYLVKYVAARQDEGEDIWKILQPMRRAARETGELPYLIDKVREAVEFCRRNRLSRIVVQLEIFLADIYHLEHVSSERAIRIWEHILRMATGPLNDTLASAQNHSTQMLADHYFARARETSGLERAQYVSSLEAMAKSKGRLGEFYNLSEASTILGLWYLLNDQPAEAKMCFQVHIRQALYIISDDDPDNDYQGFLRLADVLLRAGDERNALAMFQKLFGINEDSNEPQEETQAMVEESHDQPKMNRTGSAASLVEKNNPRDDSAGSIQSENNSDSLLPVNCDGLCSPMRIFARKDPYWICRFCSDAGFCEACFELLRAGELPVNKCSPNHDWICFKATDKRIPTDQILVGEAEFIDLEVWKKELKKTWGV